MKFALPLANKRTSQMRALLAACREPAGDQNRSLYIHMFLYIKRNMC